MYMKLYTYATCAIILQPLCHYVATTMPLCYNYYGTIFQHTNNMG
jgi:hypothetical protein